MLGLKKRASNSKKAGKNKKGKGGAAGAGAENGGGVDDNYNGCGCGCGCDAETNETTVGAGVPDVEGGGDVEDCEEEAAKMTSYGRLPSSGCDSGSSTTGQLSRLVNNRWLWTTLILVLGGAASTAFLVLGILDEQSSLAERFKYTASGTALSVKAAWHDYELFALWAHESCSQMESHDPEPTWDEALRICTWEEFRNVYEQILSSGLGLFSLQYVTRVDHRYRADVEEDSRIYVAEHMPGLNYTGFTALGEGGIAPSLEKEYYYPIHRVEPLAENAAVLDMDVYGDPGGRTIMDIVFETHEPLLYGPVKLVQDYDPDAYSVFLTHPGVPTSVKDAQKPLYAVTSCVIRIPDLLSWAVKDSIDSRAVYMYDKTDDAVDPAFLGGVEVWTKQSGPHTTKGIKETAYADVPRSKSVYFETDLDIVQRKWVVVVVPLGDAHQPHMMFIILGGVIIFCSFLILAYVFKRYLDRIVVNNMIKSKAESEKALMALHQVQRERHLNEYLAHEVRNPLTSAMAALSFVTANTREKIECEDTRDMLLDDVKIVDSSLQYINDLLRSMLDMNRAANGQIKIDSSPTDILRDVLEPSAAILCMRGAKVSIETDAPPDLFVATDRLRLKQIVLNLSVNATKFVERGFIRIRAENKDNNVKIIVEDSGPGLPQEKRAKLFESFQESLDLLHQGTGIGLFICRYLSTLMGAKISLDESYDSGISGCPGARFIIDLRKPPIADFSSMCAEMMAIDDDSSLDSAANAKAHSNSTASTCLENSKSIATIDMGGDTQEVPHAEPVKLELPESMRVLFVDDETILRKLFIRTVQRVTSTWTVEEACNADTALQLVESKNYDVIFMDQYMPCIERPLLGTEAVRQLRAKGCTSIICGLSANDLKSEFMDAGADGFLLKPFPCEKNRLKEELQKLFQPRPPVKNVKI